MPDPGSARHASQPPSPAETTPPTAARPRAETTPPTAARPAVTGAAGLDEPTILTPAPTAARPETTPLPAEPRPPVTSAAGLDEPTVLTPMLNPTLRPTLGPTLSPALSTASTPPGTPPVPGRRGRDALLRPPATTLALTLAAVVAGIGSVAVIISAVNQGDAGPPVYATGAPTPTAPAPLPSETVAAQATSAPSPTPEASRPAAPSTPPAPTGVLRRGNATLQSGQSIDLDGGGSQPDIVAYGGDNIRSAQSGRPFAAEPTATKQACAGADSYQRSVQDLTAGKGICVRTDKGRYAHITVTRTAPLGFSYVVWS